MKKLIICLFLIPVFVGAQNLNELTQGISVDTTVQLKAWKSLEGKRYHIVSVEKDTINTYITYHLKNENADVIALITGNIKCGKKVYHKAITIFGSKGVITIDQGTLPSGTHYIFILVNGEQVISQSFYTTNYFDGKIKLKDYRIKYSDGKYSIKYIGIKDL